MTDPETNPDEHSAHAHDHAGDEGPVDPVAHWEEVYGRRSGASVWSGDANASMVDAVSRLGRPAHGPGVALDLGAGEGGDAIWLARNGWRVVGVELSPTAADRAEAAAIEAGVAAQVHVVRADLATWDPSEAPELADGVDLVTASFLHSRIDFPRVRVLRRAAAAIRPGGHLVIVSHAGPPPWADGGHAHEHLPLPPQELAELDMPDADWTVIACRTVERAATGPDGESALLTDGQIVLRRR